MRSLFGLMLASAMILFLGYTGYMHFQHATDSVEVQLGKNVKDQARQAEKTYEEAQRSKDSVAIAGPLATFMAHNDGSDSDSIETIAYTPTESDHVGGSVVGTTSRILHQNFAVANMVDLPFEVPAHAYSPQFHGSFRSFTQAGGKPTTAPGDVDFLLLNDQQFSSLLAGRPDDALFSADATHDQEVNAHLPPTLNQAIKYHLVFRNDSPKAGKKVIQADFQVDF